MTSQVSAGPKDPTADLTLRDSNEIQGDILAGFKKDNVTMIFLQFGDVAGARSWLEKLAPQIATTRKVATFNKEFSDARKASAGDDPKRHKATWLGLGFTHEGLKFFTGQPQVFPKVPVGTTIEAFVQGPYERALALGDTDDSAPKHWLFGSNRTIHAVLTIASDTTTDLGTALKAQREAASRAGALIVFEQDGATLPGNRRGKEHFGFKDGVSEPGVRGFDPEDPDREGYVQGHPGTRLVEAGEFVIGEQPSPAHSPDTYAKQHMPAWMDNGSFQVVRRLEQDVPGWWAQVNSSLRELIEAKAVPEGAGSEWLAARMIGRWRSGASVAKCPMKPANTPDGEADNEFDYANDPDGLGTPLFSHLRKTYPRGGLVDGGQRVDEKFMDARRIMRRGAPYGQPFDPTSDDEASSPDASRGLLFSCYQADLVGQFEFIQADWVNDPDFPHGRSAKPGPDAMISGRLSDVNDGEVSFESHSPAGERQTTTLSLNQFVRTRGAVYAFTPSISTLNLLAKGRLNGEQAQDSPVDAALPIPGRDGCYWVFEQGTVREAAAGSTGSAGAPLSSWPALKGITRIDAILPIPDLQHVKGTSFFWVFHTVGGSQVYRNISIDDAAPNTSRSLNADQQLSRWNSLGGVTHVDAFLPIPDQQPMNGRHYYWMFHTTAQGQRYRIVSVSVSDGGQHGDKKETDDRGLNAWSSLGGADPVDTFVPVPGKQQVGGKSRSWAFHGGKFRTISVDDGSAHADAMVEADRPTSSWPTRP